MRMAETTEKRVFLLFLCGLFLALLALNVLTPFLADDYTYAFSFADGARIAGVGQLPASLAAHGREMNGRYAPHFFVQLFTLLPGWLFDLCNSLAFVALMLGLCRLGAGEKRYDWKLLALSFSAVFLCAPDVGGSMLWLSGSLNYLWCGALSLWLLVPFGDALLRGRAAPAKGVTALLCLGGLLAGNGSESWSAALALLMLACALCQRAFTKKLPLWMLAVSACTLAGWLFLILAPGDSQRISGGLQGGLGFYMERFLAALERWQESLLPLSVAWLFLLAFGLHAKAGRERLAFSGLLFGAALLCNFAMLLADYYPLRAVFWPLLMLVAACGVLVPALGAGAKPALCGGALALCFLAVFALLQALPNDYDRFRQFQAREADILSQRDAGATDIVTFGVLSRSRYDACNDLMELTTQADYRVNRSMARYYGVQTIVADRFE